MNKLILNSGLLFRTFFFCLSVFLFSAFHTRPAAATAENLAENAEKEIEYLNGDKKKGDSPEAETGEESEIIQSLKDEGIQKKAEKTEDRKIAAENRISRGSALNIGAGETVNDVIIIGGSAIIREKADIRGDVVIFGGSASIGSEVKIAGDLVVFGGSAAVDANTDIHGDAVIVGGSISLLDNSKIHGDVVVFGGRIDTRDPEAVKGSHLNMRTGRIIRDAIKRSSRDSGIEIKTSRSPGPMRTIAFFFLVFVMGLVLNSTIRTGMQNFCKTAVTRIPMSILAGLLGFMALILIMVVFAITIIGIVFIPLLILTFLILLLMGWAVAAMALGRNIPTGNEKNEIVDLALGTGIFCLIGIMSSIPFLGFGAGIIMALASLAGAGAVILNLINNKKDRNPLPSPASDHDDDEIGTGTPLEHGADDNPVSPSS